MYYKSPTPFLSKFVPFPEPVDPPPSVVRKVVCAANLYFHEKFPNGQLIIPGPRHHSPTMNSILIALKLFDGDFSDHIAQAKFEGKTKQGFIDQFDVFMDRKEALQVALAAGQSIDWKRNGSKEILFSEGLY